MHSSHVQTKKIHIYNSISVKYIRYTSLMFVCNVKGLRLLKYDDPILHTYMYLRVFGLG